MSSNLQEQSGLLPKRSNLSQNTAEANENRKKAIQDSGLRIMN